jgi:hypothetical protein
MVLEIHDRQYKMGILKMANLVGADAQQRYEHVHQSVDRRGRFRSCIYLLDVEEEA